MLEVLFSKRSIIQPIREGILGPHLDALAPFLLEQGYARGTAAHKIRVLADLGRWLERPGRRMNDLDEEMVEAFLRSRQRHAKIQRGDRTILRLLLGRLRSSGEIPPPAPRPENGQIDGTIRAFREYLARERGLARITVSLR